jgi:predicted anti-sigma-YlaC factor YlaD
MFGDKRTNFPLLLWMLLLTVAVSTSGCSPRSLAVDAIGDMLSQGGSAFAEDDDIELVGEALPFSLKLSDSLLRESPKHRGLLRAAAQGYVLYAYAYVQFPAERAATDNLRRARYLRGRARRLYRRAFDYAVRGLEVNQPGIGKALRNNPAQALRRIDSDATAEVPFLYWAASALGLAISVSKDDPGMLARIPEVKALLRRALALDETFDEGALHEFALILAGAAPLGPDHRAADRHYRRALELSGGKRASLYVAFALAVPLPAQDRKAFQTLIEKALAVEPDAVPGQMLQNVIAQRRARWLAGRMNELFLN